MRRIETKERRRFRRFPTAMEARYTKVKGHLTINSLGRSNDISLGGLCVRLGRIVKNGDELLIEIDLPQDKKLATLAKVVWIKATEREGYPYNMCGVQFQWVSSDTLLSRCISLNSGIAA
ncbi:MAG: PilZ domain-containing protein [Candidatus Omnitrophica bacterium]|nr:PilZ domain-containing protein [Candidatus Omnitrophota bacterium]